MKNHTVWMGEDGTLVIGLRGAPMIQFRFEPGESEELVATIRRLESLVAERVEKAPEFDRGRGIWTAHSDETEANT